MMTDPYTAEERSLGAVLSEFFSEFRRFWAQTAELAGREMGAMGSRAAASATNAATGLLLAFAGFLFLLLAAVSALALVLPIWAACLLVGGVVFLVGAAVTLAGVNALKRMNYVPEQTLASLKEDQEWTGRQT